MASADCCRDRAWIQPRLNTIAAQRPYKGRLAPPDAELKHETIETIALSVAVPHSGECQLEDGPDIFKRDMGAVFVLHEEFVNP